MLLNTTPRCQVLLENEISISRAALTVEFGKDSESTPRDDTAPPNQYFEETSESSSSSEDSVPLQTLES